MSNPWLKFYPSDWRSDPALRMCSIGARGLWMEMLCVMHENSGELSVNGKGLSLKQLATLAGCPDVDALIEELEDAGVFSRRDDGTIYSRRMIRDAEKATRDHENGKDGGNPNIRRGTVPKELRVRPYRRSDAPEKTLRIFNRGGGKCHWCSAELLFNGVGGEPNLFHVDHVLPICDGGTNDESNLVAACADCNHKRARIADPTGSPVSVGKISDVKAQKPEARYQKEEVEKEEPSGSSKKRGSRIPDDFVPDLDWAASLGLSPSQARSEAAQFRDYWTAKAGAGATKLDWPATWRTWVRSAVNRMPRARGSPGHGRPEKRDPFKDLAQELTDEHRRESGSSRDDPQDARGLPILTIEHHR